MPESTVDRLLPDHDRLYLEVIDNDWDGNGHDEDAGDGAHGPDTLAEHRGGLHVPVPHRGHRDHTPPEAVGYRVEIRPGLKDYLIF